MKNFWKFSAMVAVLLASATFASADTVTLASYGTGPAPATCTPNCNTALNFAGSVVTGADNLATPTTADIATGTNNTFNIGTNGIWAGPIAGSSWVSNNAQSFPGGTYVAPDGYYAYTTTFTANGGLYTGNFSILADDTVAVFLNGNLSGYTTSDEIINAGAAGGDSKCADNAPDCREILTINPLNVNLVAGTNTLTFVVEQTGLVAEGLDFAGSLQQVVTPEPSSLILLGTGLLGSAGALLRRKRA